MKIVFMGTPDFSVNVLQKIHDAGHEIGFVLTQPDKAKNRGKKIQFTPVKEKALQLGLNVYQPEKVRNNAEILGKLREYNPDIIVVVAYGQILPKEILDLPKYGCINVHASLLPRLRGASPIQHAIVCGEEVTGVTIMQMSEGLDTGDMLTKVSTKIERKNASQLHDELSVLGADLLVETLSLIEQGKVFPEKQDDKLSTYTKMISKQDGKIDFSNSPVDVERLVRGFDPWPGAFCQYQDIIMKIWKSEPLEVECNKPYGEIISATDKGIEVSCGGKVLLIEEIQVPGKKRVTVADYLRGHKILLGEILK
ncbi:MAG: methionyl-tRNA formyltransferase [Eubacteriales bacterium]|nr:methionyl-tRNA formyltransferase [Eubacteriales bacterium]